MLSGLAHPLSCLLGQFYYAAQAGLQSVLPNAAVGEGLGPWEASFHCLAHHMADERGTTCSPIFQYLRFRLPVPPWQGDLYCVTQMRCRTFSTEFFSHWEVEPILTSVASREMQGQLRTGLSSQPSVVSGTTGINKDCGYFRAMYPDMGPSSRPVPGITMALGGDEIAHLSPFPTTFTSSNMPLSPGEKQMSSKERQFQTCIPPGSMIFSNQYFLSLSPILTESISVPNLSDKAQLGFWKSNFAYLEIYLFSCLCWNGRDYFDHSKYKNYFETSTLMCVSMPAVKQLNHSHNSKTRSIWPFWPIMAFINCCS